MRWWLRVLLTLVLAPPLWRLGSAYLASQLGTSWSDLAQQSVPLLGKVYMTFTLPALVLCGGILALADIILHRLGLDLLTVIISPLLAFAVVLGIVGLVKEPHVQSANGAIVLAIVYGLVWGLTIREPRPPGAQRAESPQHRRPGGRAHEGAPPATADA